MPWLGGATCSFTRGDKVIDNGQHVFLRCCTDYQELLARLGMTGSVSMQERFDVTVLTPGGQARLRRNSLPAPLHLTGALARYGLLTPAERLKVGRAALGHAVRRPGQPAAGRASGSATGWAARWQGERARRRLWDLFIISALNIAGDDASTALAATVIKTALLGRQGRRRHRHLRHPARRPARQGGRRGCWTGSAWTCGWVPRPCPSSP